MSLTEQECVWCLYPWVWEAWSVWWRLPVPTRPGNQLPEWVTSGLPHRPGPIKLTLWSPWRRPVEWVCGTLSLCQSVRSAGRTLAHSTADSFSRVLAFCIDHSEIVPWINGTPYSGGRTLVRSGRLLHGRGGGGRGRHVDFTQPQFIWWSSINVQFLLWRLISLILHCFQKRKVPIKHTNCGQTLC